MELTFTQCKQIIQNHDRDTLEQFIDDVNNQPEFISSMQPIDSVCDLQAILQGGCASGAYMPAVSYYTASKCMGEHGDDVLDYIEESLGELPEPEKGTSWSGLAVHYLSCAVELWVSQFSDVLDGVNWD